MTICAGCVIIFYEVIRLKTAVLFGAGQAGAAVLRLLYGYEPLCFADNDEKKRGGEFCSLPVLSAAEALALGPDCVFICVTDAARAAQMRAQLDGLGCAAEVRDALSLRVFDARAAAARLLAERISARGVGGDAAELGVYRGEFAALINAALPERRLHLFDTFTGFDAADVAAERALGLSAAGTGDFSATARETVERRLPRPEQAVFHVGRFPESFAGCEGLRFCLVSIDADLYAPTAAALPLFYDRLSIGGAIIVHDAFGLQYPGAGRALEEFCAARGLTPVPAADIHGSAILVKQGG